MQGIAFGPTIRLLRQAKGISLRELARKLGVSPAFLSQIEAGRQHKIPKARIVQVALKATTRLCNLHSQGSPERIQKAYACAALLSLGLNEIIADMIGDKAVASFAAAIPLG